MSSDCEVIDLTDETTINEQIAIYDLWEKEQADARFARRLAETSRAEPTSSPESLNALLHSRNDKSNEAVNSPVDFVDLTSEQEERYAVQHKITTSDAVFAKSLSVKDILKKSKERLASNESIIQPSTTKIPAIIPTQQETIINPIQDIIKTHMSVQKHKKSIVVISSDEEEPINWRRSESDEDIVITEHVVRQPPPQTTPRKGFNYYQNYAPHPQIQAAQQTPTSFYGKSQLTNHAETMERVKIMKEHARLQSMKFIPQKSEPSNVPNYPQQPFQKREELLKTRINLQAQMRKLNRNDHAGRTHLLQQFENVEKSLQAQAYIPFTPLADPARTQQNEQIIRNQIIMAKLKVSNDRNLRINYLLTRRIISSK